MWARVENGRVVELTDIDPAGRFTPEIVSQFMQCPAGVQQGWLVVGESFIPPIGLTPGTAATAKRAAINAERNRREQLGFSYLAKTFDSDQVSVIRINAAVNTAVAAILNSSTFTVTWTCADNSTIELSAQQFLGLAVALAAYSDGLHQTARTLKAAVDAALAAGATAVEIEAMPIWAE